MEKNIQNMENRKAEILAGLSDDDRFSIIKLKTNKPIIFYVEGCGHYKKIYTTAVLPVMILITFGELQILLDYVVFDAVHESYLISFDQVVTYSRCNRDVFADMYNKQSVPVGRKFAPSFIAKCKAYDKKLAKKIPKKD